MDVNLYMVNTIFASKPAGTTRTNTTTLANDPDLSVTLATSSLYFLELLAPLTSPAAAGFKFGFTVPAGSTFAGYAVVSNTGVVNVFPYSTGGNPLTQSLIAATQGGGFDDMVNVRGWLTTGGTGGALTFQWAQNTSNAAATILRQGSAMLVRRVS
jgi:hypothetical protein